MVLESLINPTKARKKPWEVFFLGIIYSSIALILSLWVFEEHASLVMVFLIVVACVPLFYNTIRAEEKKGYKHRKRNYFIKRARKGLIFLYVLVFWNLFVMRCLVYPTPI
jgi:c-di-AMP phosphodiesterase-like protein